MRVAENYNDVGVGGDEEIGDARHAARQPPGLIERVVVAPLHGHAGRDLPTVARNVALSPPELGQKMHPRDYNLQFQPSLGRNGRHDRTQDAIL